MTRETQDFASRVSLVCTKMVGASSSAKNASSAKSRITRVRRVKSPRGKRRQTASQVSSTLTTPQRAQRIESIGSAGPALLAVTAGPLQMPLRSRTSWDGGKFRGKHPTRIARHVRRPRCRSPSARSQRLAACPNALTTPTPTARFARCASVVSFETPLWTARRAQQVRPPSNRARLCSSIVRRQS